jgi:hypothetical protein
MGFQRSIRPKAIGLLGDTNNIGLGVERDKNKKKRTSEVTAGNHAMSLVILGLTVNLPVTDVLDEARCRKGKIAPPTFERNELKGQRPTRLHSLGPIAERLTD